MKHQVTKSSRRSISEWLSVRLDIPADLSDGLRLDLRGRHTLTVHGCRRILDFTPCEIRLSLPETTLVVCGERLICTSYLAGAVGIEGLISGLRFEDTAAEEVSP